MIVAAVYRAYRARKKYQRRRTGVIIVQKLVRGYLARRHYRALRVQIEQLQGAVRVALAIQVLRGVYYEQTETADARQKRYVQTSAATPHRVLLGGPWLTKRSGTRAHEPRVASLPQPASRGE